MKILLIIGCGFVMAAAGDGDQQGSETNNSTSQSITVQSDAPVNRTDAPGPPTTTASANLDVSLSTVTELTTSSLMITTDGTLASSDLHEENMTQTMPGTENSASGDAVLSTATTTTTTTTTTSILDTTLDSLTLPTLISTPDIDTTGGPRITFSSTSPHDNSTPTSSSMPTPEGNADVLSSQPTQEGNADVLSSQPTPEGNADVLSSQPTPEGNADVLSSQPTPEGNADVLSSQPTPEGNADVLSSASTTVGLPPTPSTHRATEQEESTVVQNTSTATTTSLTDIPATASTSTATDTTDTTITTSTVTMDNTTTEVAIVTGATVVNTTYLSSGVCFGKTEVNTLVVVAVVVAVNVLSVVLTAACVHRLVSRRRSWDPPPIFRHKSTQSLRGEKLAQGVGVPGRHLASDRECKAGEGEGQTGTQIPILITNEDGWCVPYSNQTQGGRKKREKDMGAPTEDTGV